MSPKTVSSPTLLHVICDYAPGGLEFGEIYTQLHHFLADPQTINVHFTSIPSLDVIGIGFVTQQYALAPHQGRMVIYGNAAPRKDTVKAKQNNVDHGIVYAKLKNGVEIVNVWSEYAFAFVKSEITELRAIDCPVGGSQFRSRDFFPEKVAEIVNGDYSSLREAIPVDTIPDLPTNVIVWTDGFGNIKTSMRLSDLKARGLQPGDKARVTVNGISLDGVVAVGGFSVDKGTLAINIGSSGFADPFVELFIRVHNRKEQSAAEHFGYPLGGDTFTLEAK